jgi:hypothetical protein
MVIRCRGRRMKQAWVKNRDTELESQKAATRSTAENTLYAIFLCETQRVIDILQHFYPMIEIQPGRFKIRDQFPSFLGMVFNRCVGFNRGREKSILEILKKDFRDGCVNSRAVGRK